MIMINIMSIPAKLIIPSFNFSIFQTIQCGTIQRPNSQHGDIAPFFMWTFFKKQKTISPLRIPRWLFRSAYDDCEIRNWLSLHHIAGQKMPAVHSLAEDSCSCPHVAGDWERVAEVVAVKAWAGVKVAIRMRQQLTEGFSGRPQPTGKEVSHLESGHRNMQNKPAWWKVGAQAMPEWRSQLRVGANSSCIWTETSVAFRAWGREQLEAAIERLQKEKPKLHGWSGGWEGKPVKVMTTKLAAGSKHLVISCPHWTTDEEII